MFQQRLDLMYSILEQDHLDGAALIPGPTFAYLTGLQYHTDERPKVLLLRKGSQPVLILPEFEAGKLAGNTLNIQPFTFGEDSEKWPAAFQKAAEAAGLAGKKYAVEPLSMRVRELRLLEDATPTTQFVSTTPRWETMRMRKDEDEVASMRKAAQIAEQAFLSMLKNISAGMTEKEVAAELVSQLLKHGSEPNFPFLPIIASGPNGANPHAVPSDRKLTHGELVVVDWGARYDGYCSDITRTVAVGEINPELNRVAQIVIDANAAGVAAARAGAPAHAVDNASRGVIENADFGQFFTHRTGHG
ncbi:MAG: Xaa-Pro peptidase family protein, partial [Anaerolineaceae bacterium]